MERRKYGTGALKQVDGKEGQWLLRVCMGKNPRNGKYEQRSWRFNVESHEEAEKHSAELIASVRPLRHRKPGTTVAYLLEKYLEFSVVRGLAPATLKTNRRIIDQVFIPEIGDVKVRDLTTFDIDHLYMRLMSRPKPPEPSSIKRYHAVLAAAMNQGVRWRWVDVNPAVLASLPLAPRRHADIPTREVVREVIRACKQEDALLGVFVLMAAATGCRRGELAALRWTHLREDLLLVREAVHLVDGVWCIKSTKTGQVRSVMLGKQLGSELQKWRCACEETARSIGLRLLDDAFIFPGCTDGSTMINPNRMTHLFGKVADSLDPPHPELHLHSLRHFAATELVAAGVSIRDVAERLGHADPAWTLIVYSHARADGQRESAKIAERVIFG